jgi:hypothetical protein
MKRRASILSIASGCASVLVACRHFDHNDASEVVARIGAHRIRGAAQSLGRFRRGKTRDRNVDVPRADWPSVLGELDPQKIYIDDAGVYVARYEFFMEAEGLYVLFDGESDLENSCCDPSYQKVAERIYWYQYTG